MLTTANEIKPVKKNQKKKTENFQRLIKIDFNYDLSTFFLDFHLNFFFEFLNFLMKKFFFIFFILFPSSEKKTNLEILNFYANNNDDDDGLLFVFGSFQHVNQHINILFHIF